MSGAVAGHFGAARRGHRRGEPRRWAWLAAAVCALALAACGGGPRKDPLADVSWSYATDAVMFELVADPGLNQYDGDAHTLLLGVYETADAQAFRNLAADPAALANTMATGKVPSTFVQFSRYVVAPGQHSYLILDRAQNTRTIGLVAGYAQLGAANAVRQFDVPVVTKTSGFIFRTHTLLPAPLVVRLNLGPQGIVNSEVLANGPSEADLQRAQRLEGGGKELRVAGGGATGAPSASPGAGTLDTPLRKLGN